MPAVNVLKTQNASLKAQRDSARAERDAALKEVADLKKEREISKAEWTALQNEDVRVAQILQLKKRIEDEQAARQKAGKKVSDAQAELGYANEVNVKLEKQNAALETQATEQLLNVRTAHKAQREKWDAERERLTTAIAESTEIAKALTERNLRLARERNDAVECLKSPQEGDYKHSKVLEEQTAGAETASERLVETELRETCDDLREQLNIYMAAGTQLLTERANLQEQILALSDSLEDALYELGRRDAPSPSEATDAEPPDAETRYVPTKKGWMAKLDELNAEEEAAHENATIANEERLG